MASLWDVPNFVHYLQFFAHVTVADSQFTYADFWMDALDQAIVSGNVVDTDGLPVQGATVTLYRPWGNPAGPVFWGPMPYVYTATTDANGDYYVKAPAGAAYNAQAASDFVMVCVAPGYQTQYLSAVALSRNVEAIQHFFMPRGALVSQNLDPSAYTTSSAALPVTSAFDGDFFINRWIVEGFDGWAEIDLGQTLAIPSIFVQTGTYAGWWGPSDLVSMEVWVSDSPIQGNYSAPAVSACTWSADVAESTPVSLQLAEGTAGRYVAVHFTSGWQWVNIAEIQVFAEPAYINGVVRSTEAGNPPIAGASVWTEDGQARTLTDQNGSYNLAVSPGSHTVIAGKAGYTKASATVPTESGQTTPQDFGLSPASMGTVSGHVSDAIPGEGPIVGATIRTDDLLYSATSDGSGNYSMPIEAGDVNLIASKPGYVSQTASTNVLAGETTTQDFALASTTDGVITGVVLKNEAGLPPCAGATVYLSETSDWGYSDVHGATTTTAADGTFRQRLPAGNYVVVAIADGYTPASTQIAVGANQAVTANTLKPIACGPVLSRDLDGSQYTSSGDWWIYYARRAFDGIFQFPLGWAASTATCWLQVDLGEAKDVGGLSWTNLNRGWTYVQEVYVSDSPIGADTSTATRVAAFRSSMLDGETCNCWFPTGTTGRYVQLNLVGNPALPPVILETQVYGASSLAYTTVASLADAKGMADGTAVSITDPQVVTVDTGMFADASWYVENTDRTSAMKVISACDAGVVLNDSVTLQGIVCTDEMGEKYLYATNVVVVAGGGPIGPLGTTNKSISAAASNALSGILSRTWGKVTSIDPDGAYVYVDDGSGIVDATGNNGVRITLSGLNTPITDLSVVTEGQTIAVTGIVVPVATSEGTVVSIRPRSDDDVDVF